MSQNYNSTMNIEEPWFSLIKCGIKTIEGRKASPTWITLKEDDVIKVTCNGNTPYYVKITNIKKYTGQSEFDSLSEYLIMEGVNNTLHGVKTLSKAREVYLQWNSLDEIERYGMLAIHVVVVDETEPCYTDINDASDVSDSLCTCKIFYDYPFNGIDYHHCCNYCSVMNRPFSDDSDSIVD